MHQSITRKDLLDRASLVAKTAGLNLLYMGVFITVLAVSSLVKAEMPAEESDLEQNQGTSSRAPTPEEARRYRRALELRQRMEDALRHELQADLPRYEAISQGRAESSAPLPNKAADDSPHETVIISMPGPVLEQLVELWGETVAVSTLKNGWKQIFLPTPDNASRRQKLSADISTIMGRTMTIPWGTDRVLIAPN